VRERIVNALDQGNACVRMVISLWIHEQLINLHLMLQKKNMISFALLAMPFIGFSQFIISGKVKNKETQEHIQGAVVNVASSLITTTSKADGSYELPALPAGTYVLQTSLRGFTNSSDTIRLTENKIVAIELSANSSESTKDEIPSGTPATSLFSKQTLDQVVVSSTRTDHKYGMAYSNVYKEQIAEQNLGQDLPYLLNQQPSVVTTSDAGTGIGYTGIRIRGSDATRVNVTINGIPVNDAESQGAFWVDLPDIASSIDNIQVQRGVGTSTNGAGSFGGSLNIQTTKLNAKPYAEYNAAFGSFNTFKNTVNVGSGLINEFAVDARLSKITSDGFIDRGTSNLQSYYLSGGYYGKSDIVKFITFSGQEETYQAWNGIPEARLKGDVQGMEAYIARNYLDEEDAANLRNANSRTYNQFLYANQVDHYKQDYYQLHFTHEFNENWNSHVALHYTKGKGYYEEYKKGEAFSKYGLSNVMIGSDTITSTNLVRRRWLDNDFYGTTFSLNYNSKKKLSGLIGGAWNQYAGQHYGEVIWAQYASNAAPHQQYYNENASKTDFTIFIKLNYQLFNKLNIFADLQERNIYYKFLGYNRFLENVQQSISLNFINPKVGLTYELKENAHLYASYSIGQKEPGRNAYTQSTPDSRPRAEKLQDWEMGYRQQTKFISWSLNLYYMNYKDQLIVTGQVNDVGAYIQTNVPESYRRGIEAEFGIQLLKKMTWNFNTTFSQNKIKNYTEFIDDYDLGEQTVTTYPTTDIAFSPSVIGGSTIAYEVFQNFKISFISKYVGKQYLDNTSSDTKKLDAFFVNDVRVNYNIPMKRIREIGFILALNNVFNEQYESNGYTYGYVAGGQRITENFYYPQAGINVLGGIRVKF
jgi:iron complex outermembrane receptor protein